MSTMQKMMLIGYLGRDPETRYTPSGAAVTQFSVATTESWTDKNTQQKQERTTWHYCECWGRLAEVAGEYLHKGAQVYVEGKIRQEEWEKDGQTQRMTKVRIDQMQFLKTDRDHQGQKPSQGSDAAAPAAAAAGDDFSDDIPF